MAFSGFPIFFAIGLLTVLNLASAAYQALAILCIKKFALRLSSAHERPSRFRLPLSVLKPISGVDAELESNLRSFFMQDYPDYQIVFAVSDSADPAIGIIERLRSQHPNIDSELVIALAPGPNYKVGNLLNARSAAKHDILVVADSDMRVDPHYLDRVSEPFADPSVGAVTCLYKGVPAPNFASRLGALHINGWFLPSVLVRAYLGPIRFCLGATMAMRQKALGAIGGFEALLPYLADDHRLGALIAEKGYRVMLAESVVEDMVDETTLGALFRHELRWARTVRTVAPLGHAFSFLMYTLPIALITAGICTFLGKYGETLPGLNGKILLPIGIAFILLAFALRAWMQCTVQATLSLRPDRAHIWLAPVRDILSFLVWGASFFGRRIVWRDHSFIVGKDGRLIPSKTFQKT